MTTPKLVRMDQKTNYNPVSPWTKSFVARAAYSMINIRSGIQRFPESKVGGKDASRCLLLPVKPCQQISI